MIIKDLHVDGFGVWSDLELGDLDSGLTLLYGENETGKSTLLEFIRSVLYGFNDERRHKYLPPVRGGLGGGTLGVATHAGKFRIKRRAEGDTAVGRLDLTSYTGTAQDVRQLKKILADLDESTFKNVFALGLGEIQELGTLSGGGAAEFLYDLAVGSGGVSLTEVQRELDAMRGRIFSHDRDSQVGKLLDRRSKLLSEIEQLRQIGRSYALLADERERLVDDVRRCEVEAGEVHESAGLYEAAINVFEPWHRRLTTSAKLEAIGELAPIPDDAWQKLGHLRDRYRELRPSLDKLKTERAAIRKKAFEIPVNKVLWRQGPRLEVLHAQLGWIEQLETEIRKLETDSAAPAQPARRETLSGDFVKLGLTPSSVEKLSDRRLLANLYRVHKERREHDKRVETAAEADARHRELIEHAAPETKAASTGRRESSTIDSQAQLVAALRKRVQIEQKAEQLAKHREDSQRRLRELLPVNDLSRDPIFNLNTVFVVGAVLFAIGWAVKDGLLGIPNLVFLFIGGALAGVSFVTRVMRDMATNEQLENLRSQARSIDAEISAVEKDREELDAQIPGGSGPLAARLQQAERELANLEDHAAGENRRVAVRDDLETVRVEYRTAQELAEKATRRWHHELERAGLPAQITWEQLRAAARSRGKQDSERRRIERRLKFVERRRSELALIADRVAQAFVETQLEPRGERVSEQVRHLHAQWQRNEEQLERRKEFRREYRAVDRKLRAGRTELTTLLRRRKTLLRSVGASSEKHLLRRRDRLREQADLRELHERLSREIAAGLGQKGTEDELRSKLENFDRPQLEQRWTELCERHDAIEARLKELYAEQGRLQEKLAAVAADVSLPKKLYELKTIERGVGDALKRWETLTVAGRLVEAVRKKYEAERQPETLREASRYFERLTEGRYKRIWTPLEAGILFVDTAKGDKLSVDVLSRGTREQLFLSLRLALVDLYSRRGKIMPLVLDDVLVNFDTKRTRIAAELLRDFASGDRQVLLFTCHEHIYRLFKGLRAELRLLPGQTIEEQDEGPVRVVEKVVEKIVEKVVSVKEPVYLPAPAAAPLPAMPWLDGTGVFHMIPPPPRPRPKPKVEAPPAPPQPVAPPPPPPVVAAPQYEDVVEEVVIEPPPQTIVHTKQIGYPVVPLWNPVTPFAEASWQDSIEDVEREGNELTSTGPVGRSANGISNGSSNGSNGSHGSHGRREYRSARDPRAATSRYLPPDEEDDAEQRPETE